MVFDAISTFGELTHGVHVLYNRICPISPSLTRMTVDGRLTAIVQMGLWSFKLDSTNALSNGKVFIETAKPTMAGEAYRAKQKDYHMIHQSARLASTTVANHVHD